MEWDYRYFKPEEVLSKDGLRAYAKGHLMISPELMDYLDSFRQYLGIPITVTSGYRSPRENEACGGAEFSRHVQGLAADIKIRGMTPEEAARAALDWGFKYVKVYDTWTHVDIRY